MAQLNTARGDLRAALQAGEECVELARAAEPGLIPGMAGLYMAVPLIELGEARAARDVILRMSAGDPALHTSRSGHAQAFEILTRAEVALGNLDAAESWARRAQAATHGSQLAGEATYAHRATATVALARGDAERAAEVALAAANSAPHTPIEAARCRIVAGRALARGGQRRLALETLEDAAQALADRGAHGFLAEAERELRRVGRRGTRRTAQRSGDLTALTDREREIAEGAGRGLTNRQIAAAMFLSEKTVERHLTRVFSKLGVPNRAALARMLSAAGESGAAEPGAAV
jgi:DNA-binding NarL/FixJ family response regulator